MKSRHGAVDHRAAVHKERLIVLKLDFAGFMHAGREIEHVWIALVHAEIADGIGEYVQRPMPAVQLDGILAALGNRKLNNAAADRRMNVPMQRAHVQPLKIARGDEAHPRRFVHLKADKRRDFGLLQRALAARPDGVVGHGGNAAEPRRRFLAVYADGKIRYGHFALGRMMDAQHDRSLAFCPD